MELEIALFSLLFLASEKTCRRRFPIRGENPRVAFGFRFTYRSTERHAQRIGNLILWLYAKHFTPSKR